MKIKTLLIMLIGSMMSITSAHAVPVTWTLQDVVLSDGGTASGSFVYDAATNTYSDINVTTTAGTAVAGNTYLFASSFAAAFQLDFVTTNPTTDLSGAGLFSVILGASLTDLGGTIALAVPNFEGICSDSICFGAGGPSRSFVSGFITTTPVSAVPLPASLWFMGAGLAAFGAARKKKKASA